jgi:eukaryotic-like serine/threonine-protein kinase
VATDDPDGLREALAHDGLALEQELGRGGMSVVYSARDLRHDRLVAVKVLRPDVPGGAERFVREIRLASPLVHSHIIPLYDSGAVNGTPYFVMPFIEGESLRARLQRENRLPIADAVRIAGEVAEALEYAHGRGILHRDIKPENILLQAGHALVADFGVARALSEAAAHPEDGEDSGEALTGAGLVVGTAEYMSPEQASGERNVDGRSDLYSLGCVLYEMLCGKPPFTGKNAREVMARRFSGPPPSVAELRPEIPPELAALVEQSLAADPAERVPTAGAFLAALHGSAGSAAPAKPRPRLRAEWLVPALVVAALAALGLHDRGPRTLDLRRVVVARLSNETGDSALSYVGGLAADRLTASLAGMAGLHVATSARVIPSRLTTGLQVDSLDDPGRLRTLAEETAAGTIVSGSYFRDGSRILIQAEITNANDGNLVAAVGPVGAPAAHIDAAVDSLCRRVDGALRTRIAARP